MLGGLEPGAPTRLFVGEKRRVALARAWAIIWRQR